MLPVKALEFPPIERATLSNGMKVVFARRSAVPTVDVAVSFDAGNAADDKAKLGTEALYLSLIEEGTPTRDSIGIAEEQERLGASIGESASMDNTTITVSALKPNLAASLDLLADVVRNPAFKPEDVERKRAVLLTRIASEKTQPQGLALRVLPPLLYGASHPYGVPFTGSGTEAGVKAVTRDDLVAFHHRWIRPDNGTIFAVGDTTLAELVPMLEARFGSWAAPAGPKGVKQFPGAAASGRSRIVLIDKPQSPQSMILAGEPLGIRGTDDPLKLIVANDVLGGSSTSRLIMDLREAKGWAYFAGSQVQLVREIVPLLVFAPVQTDKTGEFDRRRAGRHQCLPDWQRCYRGRAAPVGQQSGVVAARRVRDQRSPARRLDAQCVAAPARRLLYPASGPLPCADRERARPGGPRSDRSGQARLGGRRRLGQGPAAARETRHADRDDHCAVRARVVN